MATLVTRLVNSEKLLSYYQPGYVQLSFRHLKFYKQCYIKISVLCFHVVGIRVFRLCMPSIHSSTISLTIPERVFPFLGCYVDYVCNCLPTFRGKLSIPNFKVQAVQNGELHRGVSPKSCTTPEHIPGPRSLRSREFPQSVPQANYD